MPRPVNPIPELKWRNGIAYVYWYDKEKRRTERLSLDTKDAMEAQIRYGEFLLKGQTIFARATFELTVSQVLDHYYFEHVKLKCVALTSAECVIANLKSYFGSKHIKEIGIPECRLYLQARLKGAPNGRKGKPATVAKELNILLAAANHSRKWKRLSANDMPVIEVPKTARSKGIWLFKDELERLKDAALRIDDKFIPMRTFCFIDITYYSASRRNAIEELNWQRVDRQRQKIWLAKPDEVETTKRRPVVTLDDAAMPSLEHLWKHKINDFVLGSDSEMFGWFMKAAELAGLTDLPERSGRPAAKITPHMLRHSRATHMLQDGYSLKTVADLLGDTMATVEKVYAHACQEHMSRAINAQKPALNLVPDTGSLRANGSALLSEIIA